MNKSIKRCGNVVTNSCACVYVCMCVCACMACVCVSVCAHVCMWVGCVCGVEIHRYDNINKTIQKHSNDFILVLWIWVYCLVCGLSHWRQFISCWCLTWSLYSSLCHLLAQFFHCTKWSVLNTSFRWSLDGVTASDSITIVDKSLLKWM